MSKKLLILFTFSFCLSAAFAQSKWSPRTSLPDSTRGYGIGFSIGNYGYVGLGGKIGSHWEYFNDFWQFNPSTDKWTKKADFPGNARICAPAFVIGNNAYVVCGAENNTGSDMVSECWKYNSINNTWLQKHNFPGIARNCAVSFSIGSKGYMGTGYDTLYNNVMKDFWEYDTATDTWTRKNDFGGIARYAASGFAVNGKGYICFGVDSAGAFSYITANDMWEYSPSTDSWTQKTNNPIDSLSLGNGFVIGNDIYVGTGETYSPVRGTTDFWQYNTVTDAWTKMANFIGGKRGVCSAFAVGDTGYMGLGMYDTVLSGTTSMYRFEIDSTLGIGEVNGYDVQVMVYPNPFRGSCTIASNNPIEALYLYDIEGNKIEAAITKVGNGYTIIRGNLSAGIYILSAEINNQTIHKKLLIIN